MVEGEKCDTRPDFFFFAFGRWGIFSLLVLKKMYSFLNLSQNGHFFTSEFYMTSVWRFLSHFYTERYVEIGVLINIF